VAIAFLTNYLINREEAPAKSSTVTPIIPPVVKASEDNVISQTSQSEPKHLFPAPLKEPQNEATAQANTVTTPDDNIVAPADETSAGTGNEQKIPLEKKNMPPAASQSQAVPILLPTQPFGTGSATTPLPPFTPITNATGPVVPQLPATQVSQEAAPQISSFISQPSATGPVPEPGAKYEALPPFTPIQSATGPVKTDDQ